MTSKLLLLMTIISLGLFSCAGERGETQSKIEVTVGNIATAGLAPFSDGGGILYAQNSTTGDQFSINLIDAPSDLSIPLPNGSWTFFGLLWDNAQTSGIGKFQGKPYCAFVSTTLNGGDVTLPLNFSNTNCSAPQFTSQVDNTLGFVQFPRLVLKSCNTLSNVSASTDQCDNGAQRDRGYVRSYKVVLPTYSLGQINAPLGSPLESSCILTDHTAPNVTNNTNGDIYLPGGDGVLPLETEIHAFLGDNCDPTMGVDIYSFDKGIGQDETYQGKIKSYNDSTSELTVFHKLTGQEVCSNSPVDPYLEFSTGDGSPIKPYGLCNAIQWETISKDPANLTKSFEVLQDIDFIDRTAGFYYAPAPLDAACVGYGSTFIPIGYECSGSSLVQLGTGDFSGEFYGNHKTLKNMFFLPDSTSYTGLFRKVGVSAPSTIESINIENLRLEGEQYIGGLTGYLGSAAGSTIKDIYIKGLHIKSFYFNAASAVTNDANIGGVIGLVDAPSVLLNNLVVEQAVIRAQDDRVGGIIGTTIDSLIFQEGFFDGHLKIERSQANSTENVGGILGSSDTATAYTLDQLVSKGAITGRIKYAGGLLGQNSATGSITINDSKSEMAIVTSAEADPIRIAGIVGFATTNTITINDSLFTGHLFSKCLPSVACTISEALGAGDTGTSDVAYTRDYSTSLGGIASTSSNFPASSLRSGSSYAPSANWSEEAGRFPALISEVSSFSSPCYETANLLSVADQVTNLARGSRDNPVIICNVDQFWQIEGYLNLSYRLEEHLNFYESYMTDMGQGISNFTGTFDGNQHFISGIDVTTADATTSGETGLFKQVATGAEIYDLNIVGFKSSRTNPGANQYSGALIGINSGEIKNIYGYGLTILGDDAVEVGGLIGKHSGSIHQVELDEVEVLAESTVGGLVGVSWGGNIERASVNSTFKTNIPYDYLNIGGVVGHAQNSIIDQVSWDGYISIKHTNTNTSSEIGGLVGRADTNTLITNSYTSAHSRIAIEHGSSVGGLVGLLSTGSSISKSYSGAEVQFGYCDDNSGMNQVSCEATGSWIIPSSGDQSYYGPIVGKNISASVDITTTFFTTKAYSLKEVHNGSFNPTWSGSTCDITLPVAASPSTEEFFLQGHTQYFSLDSDLGANTFTIDLDGTNCSSYSSGNLTIVKPGNSNILGTQIRHPDFFDILTFCPSANIGDPDNRCPTAEWDVSERGGGNDTGFNYLVDAYASHITGQELPSNIPMWQVGDNDFPRHFWQMD